MHHQERIVTKTDQWEGPYCSHFIANVEKNSPMLFLAIYGHTRAMWVRSAGNLSLAIASCLRALIAQRSNELSTQCSSKCHFSYSARVERKKLRRERGRQRAKVAMRTMIWKSSVINLLPLFFQISHTLSSKQCTLSSQENRIYHL